jgi:hypothetical protein
VLGGGGGGGGGWAGGARGRLQDTVGAMPCVPTCACCLQHELHIWAGKQAAGVETPPGTQ